MAFCNGKLVKIAAGCIATRIWPRVQDCVYKEQQARPDSCTKLNTKNNTGEYVAE